MGQCLLFFPILRTRSARKKLVAGSVIVLLGLFAAGCEDDTPPHSAELAARPTDPRVGQGVSDEVARRAAQELAALAIEAGIERGRDPEAPAGDLAQDLAAFTTLDACVHAHRVADPVLADAVDTLGYDTLVRDACRILSALKSKDGKLCQPIAASPLRKRCESEVAIFAGEPGLCPIVPGGGMPAREPVCLARASRDERLCTAAPAADRVACKALVRGHSNDCGNDATCIRQVERYRSLLEKPASRAPFPARLHVEFASADGKTEKYDGAFDLDDVAAAGAVARMAGDKVRLMIGTPKNGLWPSWDAPHATPLLFLALSVPTKAPGAPAKRGDGATGWALGPADLSLDLLIPQVALLTGTLATDRNVVIENVSAAAGSPVRLLLTTKMSDASRAFRVKIGLETFVRDGIDAPSGLKK